MLLFVGFTKQTQASALSLSVSPPIIQIEAIPPAEVSAPITIQNDGDDSVILKIVLKSFKAADSENGQLQYLSNADPFPGANPQIFQGMLIVDGDRAVDEITLAPKQQKKVDFRISLPEGEPFSDYYFSLVFVSKDINLNDPQTNLSQASGGIATNVLLSVGPKTIAKAELLEFSVPFFLEKGPVPFTIRVKNTGSQVLTPTGTIIIKNMFGQTAGRVDLLPVNILAGTIRAIPDSSQNPEATPSAEITNPKSQIPNSGSPIAFWPETILLGPYSATITLSLSENGPLFIRTIHIFGLPAQAALGFFIAILLTLIVYERVRKRMRKP